MKKNILFLYSTIKTVLDFYAGQISTAPSKTELSPFTTSQNPAQPIFLITAAKYRNLAEFLSAEPNIKTIHEATHMYMTWSEY